MSGYDNGTGFAPRWIPIRLDPDECLINAADTRAMRFRCSRPGHPSATSDCGKPGATIEPPEVPA